MRSRLLRIVGLVGLVLLSACRPSSTLDSTAAPLLLETLRNTAYPSAFAEEGVARLVNGRFEEWPIPNAASHTTIVLAEPVAHGDLNGDGTTDAAVLLIANTGGSGNYRELVPVLNESGTPKPLKGVLLGDRVRIESLMIEGDRIVVTMRAQGPDDPMPSPTRQVRRVYRLVGEELVPSPNASP